MRKRLIGQATESRTDDSSVAWLDLQQLSRVELTSEDEAYPIEGALSREGGVGWRASSEGRQTIRILFDDSQKIRRIQLRFSEKERPRTQEFLLRWSSDNGQTYREIVRQQYNFSPPNVSEEIEDYTVDLSGATALELVIIADISRADVRASLKQMRVE
jgi:hypothetical protein